MAGIEALTPSTVLYDQRATPLAHSLSRGDDLWLTLPDLRAATDWELKPEGVCRGELCVPIPEGDSPLFIQQEGEESWFNLTAFARSIEQPYAHDARHNVWMFGPQGLEWRQRSMSVSAPDFTLPDLDGKLSSLSDFLGSKVVLVCWATW